MSLGRNKFNGQIAWIPMQLFWELQQPGPRDILSCEYTRYWCRCTPSAFSTSLQRKVVFYQLPTLREVMAQAHPWNSFLCLKTRMSACVAALELPAPLWASRDILAGSLPSVRDHCAVKMTWNSLMDTAPGLYCRRKVIVTAKKRQKATKQ